MERLRAAIFEPGPVKTPIVAMIGSASGWALVKDIMGAAILVITFCIVIIHGWNYFVRQWCPVRYKKWENCWKCPFCKTVFCSRGTNDREDL